jgi:hypothetical protein
MFWALEPCCAQAALAKLNVETAAKSHFVMRPSSGWSREGGHRTRSPACSLRETGRWRCQRTIMARIYDVSQSDRGKELMKEILDAAPA